MVSVIEAEGGVSSFNGDDATGVGDAGVNALAGDDDAAAAADPPLDALSVAVRDRRGSGGAGVTKTGEVGLG
ncbi:hypothetical protein ABZ403_15545 [Micromonospora zamorensis]